MQAPLTIRFATDHSAAKSGMQDLAASVVSNMVKVSDALNTGIQANGGYAATVRTLATNVGTDFLTVANAGLKAANDSNMSAVAIGGAVSRAAVSTQTASVAMSGAWAVASAKAQFTYGLIRNEVAATVAMMRNSPAAMATVGTVAGLGALLLVLHETGKAAEAAEQRIDDLVKIARTASSVGVGTTFLQGLTGQAKDLGLEANAAVRALEHARDASTTRLGENGHAATSQIEERLGLHVKAGNIGQGDLDKYQSADSQEARTRVMIDLIEQLRQKGMQLASLDLAKSFFGSDFEQRMRSGIDMVGAVRKALDGLGAAGGERVISEAEIQRAQALKERVEEINNKLADGMRPVMQDIALWQQQQVGGWLDIKDKIADCIIAAGKLYLAVKDIGSAVGNADIFKNIRDWLDQRGLIDHADTARIEEMLNGGKALAKIGAPKDGEAQPGGQGPLTIRVSPKKDTSHSLPSTGRTRSSSDTDPVDTYIDGLKKSTAAIKAEVDAFNLSNAAKATAINLAKAQEIATANGKTLTEEQTAAIKAASAASAEYKDRLADLEQKQQQAAETARYFGNAMSSGLADAILEGKSLGNVLMDLEKQIARSALQAMFTGQGPLAGFLGMSPAASSGGNSVGGLAGMLGSLFGSGSSAANAPLAGAQGPTMESGGIGSLFSGLFRANGGPVRAGQAYTVGEIGQEIFVPGQDGTIVPAGRGGGGAGGAPVLNFIDQRPAGSGDLAPTTRRNPDGSTDILIRQLDAGLQARGQRGQGGLSSALNTPGTRRG